MVDYLRYATLALVVVHLLSSTGLVVIDAQTTNTTSCVTNIANAWLQPNFCARTYKSGLQRPRGLHIDQMTNELLLVERFGGYGAWDTRSRVVRLDESGSSR